MNQTMKSFISDSILDMVNSNVKIILSNKNDVLFCTDSMDRSNGYFCGNPREFCVAVNKPQKQWLPVFIHEYNHFLQWKEKSKEWFDCRDYFFDPWLSGKEYARRTINVGIRTIINVELDCEKRSVQMIKDRNLPINIDDYIKKANAYVLFYSIIKEKREWYNVSPYDVSEIIDVMPNYFLDDYSKPPQKYKKLVLKHCFK